MRSTGPASGPFTYELIEPVGGAPDLPLVVALHGRGDKAENFAHLFEDLRLEARIAVLRAPLPWGIRGGKQWFVYPSDEAAAQVSQRVEELHRLSALLKTRHPSAPPPIAVGFSQGAMMALQWVARYPEDLGGVVAMSGLLPLDEDNRKSPEPVPMLLTAGRSDNLVDPARTAKAAEALRLLGHEPALHIFDGGHAIPRDLKKRLLPFL